MNKKIFYNCVLSLTFLGLQAQTKIGSDILGVKAGEQSGGSVSISADGSTVAIGARTNSSIAYFGGLGRVFKYVSGSWTQVGDDIFGGDQDLLGTSTALSGNGRMVAFGAPFDDKIFYDTGQVKIYDLSSGNLIQIGTDINGKAEQESLGYAVSLSNDGSTVVTGAPYSGSTDKKQTGLARIYKNTAGDWTQIGTDIGEGDSDTQSVAYDRFGYSVSISSDGSIVAIGAPTDGQNNINAGKVVVYQYIDDAWTQIGSTIHGEVPGEQSGRSVSLSADGSVLAVGAPLHNGKTGRVRIYKYTESTNAWTKIGNDIEGESSNGQSGYSVSLSSDGSIVAIGAPVASQAKIYENISGNWNEIANIHGGGNLGFGVSLSSNGSSIAVGSPYDTQIGELGGKTSVYDLSAVLSSEQFVMERVSVYPNPVKNELCIQLKDDLNLQQVNIYSVLGQLIRCEKSNQINVSSLARGFYLVQVVTDKGKATQKVLVD